MISDITLSDDEKDCLQELMNVAYGSATAAISDILDAFATLSIPNIKIINADELNDYLSSELNLEVEHIVSLQQINGILSGENMFVINKESAKNIAYKFGIEENEVNDEEIADVVLEITNILSSSTISKLAEDIDTNVSFSAPMIKKLTSVDQLKNLFISKYKKVITISTELKFEDLDINGELFIFTTDNSILYIKEKLNKILDEL
jgi:chemotaxis protein CheC